MSLSLEIILTPILTLFIVQSIKLATDGIKGNFNLKNLFVAMGGMPSSHSAVVASLSTMVAYKMGANSVIFSVTAIFSLIIISDAIVLRRYIDNHGKAIKKIISHLPADQQTGYPYIATKLQHTLLQAIIGICIGIIISSLVYLLTA